MNVERKRDEGAAPAEGRHRANPFPVILSAPSGGGKTTIAHALLDRRNDLGYSISATTRAPRGTERDGRDYHFLSRDEFLARREAGEFAESAEVHGNLYGTLKAEIQKVLTAGKHVVLDIDVQGARQVTAIYPHAVTIFVLPPSGEVLLERLRGRKSESPQELVTRLNSALQELRAVEEYEYVVVNDDLDQAVRRVGAIVDAEVVSQERVEGLRHNVEQLIHRLESEVDHQTKS